MSNEVLEIVVQLSDDIDANSGNDRMDSVEGTWLK
jgi:hypothetical protein